MSCGNYTLYSPQKANNRRTRCGENQVELPQATAAISGWIAPASVRVDECHRIANANRPSAYHDRIERQAATESAADITQNLGVPVQCVGIHGRHRTACAQGVE